MSIFDLMRDGGELAASLHERTQLAEHGSADEVRPVIDPYVQIDQAR